MWNNISSTNKSGTDLTQTVKMNELFSPSGLASQILFILGPCEIVELKDFWPLLLEHYLEFVLNYAVPLRILSINEDIQYLQGISLVPLKVRSLNDSFLFKLNRIE